MRILKIATAMFVAASLAACGAGHLVVEQPNRSSIRAVGIELQAGESTTSVPEQALAYTREKLEAEIYGGDNPVFQRGADLLIRYRYVSFDRGSRAGRWLAGPFGAGQAQMVLEAEFVDPSGTVVARVRGQGELSGGFFGGSSNSAIDKAVKEIARYARQQFGQRARR